MSDKPTGRDFQEETQRKREEGKALGGRPRFEIDYQTLENLCGIFCTGDECAAILGCSYQTLNVRLAEDYREAMEELPDNKAKPKEEWVAPPGKYNGFLDCYEKNSHKGKASLRRTQFLMATGDKQQKIKPDKTMAIWMGKQHLGQKDRIDHTTKDAPIQAPVPGLDLSTLPQDQFMQLGEILRAARTQAPQAGNAQENETKH